MSSYDAEWIQPLKWGKNGERWFQLQAMTRIFMLHLDFCMPKAVNFKLYKHLRKNWYIWYEIVFL